MIICKYGDEFRRAGISIETPRRPGGHKKACWLSWSSQSVTGGCCLIDRGVHAVRTLKLMPADQLIRP
jgi:hypothetical protein